MNLTKALSINQPWAWLIVNGYKGVENRDWDTRYRGEFLVHAGKRIDYSAYAYLENVDIGIDVPPPDELPTGGIVGKANLIKTVHEKDKRFLAEKDKPFFFGKYGFILDGQEPCELKPCKGALGFFDPDYNSRYVEKQTKEKKQKAQGTLI